MHAAIRCNPTENVCDSKIMNKHKVKWLSPSFDGGAHFNPENSKPYL
jgi:hypothetical protein